MSASATAPFGFIGINAEEVTWEIPEAQDASLARMRANGITQLRLIWRWANVEQVRGQLKWGQLDQITLAAARHDIKVLPLVGGETPWATSRPPGNDERCLFPPRDNTTFANWMRLVVERYGPGGHLWDQHPELAHYALDRWQIWNEPNKTKFWACDPNPKAYVNLAREAADAIHEIDPGATIITAGAPREGKPGTYLRKMVEHGAKEVFDQLAIHTYKKDADAIIAEVSKAREIMADLGLGKWKVVITEYGWATGFPPGDHVVDEPKQARLIKNTLTKLGAQRGSSRSTRSPTTPGATRRHRPTSAAGRTIGACTPGCYDSTGRPSPR